MKRRGLQQQEEYEPGFNSQECLQLSDDDEMGELAIQSGEDDQFDVGSLQLNREPKSQKRKVMKKDKNSESMSRQQWDPCIDQVEKPTNRIQKLFKQIRNKKKVPLFPPEPPKKKHASSKKTPTPSQKDKQQQHNSALNQKQLLRIISHHIQGILQDQKHLKIDDLIKQLRCQVPQRIKDKLTPNLVKQALQLARNPLGKYSLSGKRKTKLCSETGLIKNQLDVEQYCKIVLDLLDTCKVVYFVSVEKLVDIKKSKLQYTSEMGSWQTVQEDLATTGSIMYFRGVLGSNLQSYSDIFTTNDSVQSRNSSFSFLLKVLARNCGPTQKYLFMTKAFMEQYGPSLRHGTQSGFIFCQLAGSLKAFNPLCYWLRDLKLLARKHQVHNPQQLKQILQYEACRFDKEVYSDYFRTVRRKMRKLVTTGSSVEASWTEE